MKAAVILLAAIVAVCYIASCNGFTNSFVGKKITSRCADFKLRYPSLPETANLNYILGNWYALRFGPIHDIARISKASCISSLYYIDGTSSPENSFKHVVQVRKSGIFKFYTDGYSAFTPLEDGYSNVKNLYSVESPSSGSNAKFQIQSTLVDTDAGENYAIICTCLEDSPSNATEIWTILGRTRFMDAKLHQELVEQVQELSGVPAAKLYPIDQTNCNNNAQYARLSNKAM